MNCTNTVHVPLIIEHLAIASEECCVCWLVLPFRERNNLLLVKTYHCIVFTDFQRTKLHSFHNFSLDIIIKKKECTLFQPHPPSLLIFCFVVGFLHSQTLQFSTLVHFHATSHLACVAGVENSPFPFPFQRRPRRLLRTPLFALDPHSPPIKSLELLAHGYFIQHISRTELWSHAGVRVFRAQHIGKECAAKRNLYFIKSASLACKAGVFCSTNDIETIQSRGTQREYSSKLLIALLNAF